MQNQKKSERLNQIRVTKAEKDRIRWLADQYAGGNLSAWVVLAATEYRPGAISRERFGVKKAR